jgi:hypothetical protein
MAAGVRIHIHYFGNTAKLTQCCSSRIAKKAMTRQVPCKTLDYTSKAAVIYFYVSKNIINLEKQVVQDRCPFGSTDIGLHKFVDSQVTCSKTETTSNEAPSECT